MAEPKYDIPKMCRAGVVVNEGKDFKVEVQWVPVPEPGPDEVLIKLNCTGVCGSDVHYMTGDLGRPPMSHFGVKSAGHEGAGVIVKLGSNVTNWKLGDRAGIKPMWTTCQNCELCWNGKEAHCSKTLMAGSKVTGSFQQYITSPAHYTQALPDGIDDYAAGPIMCSGGTMYKSITESGLKASEFAVFPGGGGGVGLQGVQLASHFGLRPIVIDTGEERRKLCMDRGAEAFIDFKEEKDVTAKVVELCGGVGAHGVFVTAPQAYPDAFNYLGKRIGGTIMCIGIPSAGGPQIGAPPEKFVVQNITVKGTLVATRGDIAKVLDLSARGVLKPIHTHVYPIDKLPEAVEKIRTGAAAGRSVVDFNMVSKEEEKPMTNGVTNGVLTNGESKKLEPKSLTKLYINGEYVAPKSNKTYRLQNPKDGSLVVDSVPIAGQEDVDLAVKAAEEAFNGEWRKFSGMQRAACFHKLAGLLEDELIPILTLDSYTGGNPVSIIPTREKNYIKNNILYYAGWTDKQRGDYFPADDGFVKIVTNEPMGVCAAVNPFNAPVATFILKAAPALATGNVLIVKPSEKTPLGSLALAPLFEKAGFPKGVIQVLTGPGEVGAMLASHMRVRKISFTGSVPTGKKIQEAAAKSNLKRVTLELGGKSPAVIFEDANLDNALTWTVNAILARSGQVCVAATRVYVQKSIAQEFIDKYCEKMKAAVANIGDPQDPSVAMGPLVDESQFERVQKMVAKGKEEAELVVGGVRYGDTGCYMEPTVFLNPKKDAEIYKQEIFGPVSVVKTFETEDEVIDLANDTEYGLMSGVFTKDITRALRVSNKLDSGVVGVNCVSVMNVQAAFGGRKQSGIGREMGEYALKAYTEPKTVIVNMNA